MIRYALFAMAVLLAGIAIGLVASRLVRRGGSASGGTPGVSAAPSTARQHTTPGSSRSRWPAIAAILAFGAAAAIAIAVAWNGG